MNKESCQGCQYETEDENEWCYMFKEAPILCNRNNTEQLQEVINIVDSAEEERGITLHHKISAMDEFYTLSHRDNRMKAIRDRILATMDRPAAVLIPSSNIKGMSADFTIIDDMLNVVRPINDSADAMAYAMAISHKLLGACEIGPSAVEYLMGVDFAGAEGDKVATLEIKGSLFEHKDWKVVMPEDSTNTPKAGVSQKSHNNILNMNKRKKR